MVRSNHKAELRETIERILDGHRKGFKDRLQTVELLERLHSGQDPNGRFELCECLVEAMRTNPLRSNPVEGIPANIPVVALITLARFGTTENLPALVLSLAPWADARRLGEWADEIYPLLRQCLFVYAERFDDRAFVYLRGYCDSVRRSQQAFPLPFVKAIQELERVVERVEFERFEHTLRQATSQGRVAGGLESTIAALGLDVKIVEALKEAESYLHSSGQFNPKKAADLLRSATDEAHRAVVRELERITGQAYRGEDRDGNRRAYMRQQEFISQAEESFFSAIYTLISQEASHKLIAPKETVLLLQTTVSGYLALLFRRLKEWKPTERLMNP